MEELKIENYLEDLNTLCSKCKKFKKCKDHTAICIGKKLLWNISKLTYKKRVKEGKL